MGNVAIPLLHSAVICKCISVAWWPFVLTNRTLRDSGRSDGFVDYFPCYVGYFQVFNVWISRLLQMTSPDKDFRFMATNDLMAELQKDSIKLDDESEKKVVRVVLRLLEDKNGEVQNLAVKCLGPLVNKVKENQVETIVDTLCGNMVSSNEQLRDISSIGLKTVISELPQASNSLAPNVCQRITGKLSNAIEKVNMRMALCRIGPSAAQKQKRK